MQSTVAVRFSYLNKNVIWGGFFFYNLNSAYFCVWCILCLCLNNGTLMQRTVSISMIKEMHKHFLNKLRWELTYNLFTAYMRQLNLPPLIWNVSHLKIFPLELLGPAIGLSAGPSSCKGKILRWDTTTNSPTTNKCLILDVILSKLSCSKEKYKSFKLIFAHFKI